MDFKCDTCIKAKSQRVSYLVSWNKTNTSFALIHSDVWGPSPITTPSVHRWFVIFVDDCTRMTWLYQLKTKDEVFTIFQAFHAMVQTQFSSKIKFFVLIMVENSPTEDFRPISNNIASSMRPHALKHHNKMVSQRGKIGIFWKHLMLFSSAHMCRVAIGGMLWLLPCT